MRPGQAWAQNALILKADSGLDGAGPSLGLAWPENVLVLIAGSVLDGAGPSLGQQCANSNSGFRLGWGRAVLQPKMC